MKKVALIGDSIRMGYQQTVIRCVGDLAEVYGPLENGGHSSNVLSHLNEWILSRNPSVVHINCGLHDLKKEFGCSAAAIPIEEYESNVRQVLQEILSETQATVIWATTTPVNQVWHHQNKAFDRFEADVVAYNEAALTIARELRVAVNDLFTIIMRAGRDLHLLRDGVHLTDKGYRLLGEAVARCVRLYL